MGYCRRAPLAAVARGTARGQNASCWRRARRLPAPASRNNRERRLRSIRAPPPRAVGLRARTIFPSRAGVAFFAHAGFHEPVPFQFRRTRLAPAGAEGKRTPPAQVRAFKIKDAFGLRGTKKKNGPAPAGAGRIVQESIKIVDRFGWGERFSGPARQRTKRATKRRAFKRGPVFGGPRGEKKKKNCSGSARGRAGRNVLGLS